LPAITAAVLGYVLASWLFQEPRGTLSWSWAPLFAYMLSTALIAALGGAMHRARTRAEESETRLRDFMDHSPAYVLIKDEAGRYEFLNRAAEQLLELAGAARPARTCCPRRSPRRSPGTIAKCSKPMRRARSPPGSSAPTASGTSIPPSSRCMMRAAAGASPR
jgi:PAS domain-containing protein